MKCLFCGNNRKATKEHAVPKWVRDGFSIPGPVRVLMGRGPDTEPVTVHERPHLNITLDGSICRECNNEALGDLERRVEPIL